MDLEGESKVSESKFVTIYFISCFIPCSDGVIYFYFILFYAESDASWFCLKTTRLCFFSFVNRFHTENKAQAQGDVESMSYLHYLHFAPIFSFSSLIGGKPDLKELMFCSHRRNTNDGSIITSNLLLASGYPLALKSKALYHII